MSNTIRFIGDVHGKWDRYKKLIKRAPTSAQTGRAHSIQVGDFGIGFFKPYTTLPMGGNPPHSTMSAGSHYFIRGNHDNPHSCATHDYWIADGTFATAAGAPDVFCVGGERSIDQEHRVEDYTWWVKEELSYSSWMVVMDVWETTRPDIIVTHGAPESIVLDTIGPAMKYTTHHKSRTMSALQNMLEIHQPAVWIHGHHHYTYRKVYRGCDFIGLGELDYVDLDI